MNRIEDVKSVFEALASAPSVVQKQEGKRKKTPGLEIAKPAVDDEKEQHQSECRNLDRQVVVVTEEFRVLSLFIVKERRKHRGANPENAVIDAEDRTNDDRPDQQREKERGRGDDGDAASAVKAALEIIERMDQKDRQGKGQKDISLNDARIQYIDRLADDAESQHHKEPLPRIPRVPTALRDQKREERKCDAPDDAKQIDAREKDHPNVIDEHEERRKQLQR